ncbi:uncharacterized protein LOC108095981 [Drosophila ficusphila]|uniref:uncharacterized protein LOC108095981 n=1 Tax=Drosophila ficusphila TaxID=30025 RepID=UPI0007E73A6C|nr:uncharacterized protein LOC108095981 [Drosophila ficusphila]
MLRLLILLGFCILGCQAACNTCSSTSQVACVSETEFQFCSSALVAIGDLYTCPTGYYCTSGSTVCSADETAIACSDCNKCSADNRFACTGRNTFALCLGSTTPNTVMGGNCGDYVCNLNNENICGSPTAYPVSCVGSGSGDCASTTITNATEYCQSLKETGRFPYGGVTATTCRQYVNCYVSAGIFYGNVYTCPGQTYFDSTSRLCTTQTQARCSDTVSCLTLNGRRLL